MADHRTSSHTDAFFPAIGTVAENADAQDSHQASGDDEERPVQEIESLCMNCHQQGITRMLLTSIPYFKEVIIASFLCEHCGFNNNEIQPAGPMRREGVIYTVRVLTREDLNRQVVKSQSCTTTISELDLTIPPSKGQLTTIEGVLRDILNDLGMGQPLRKYQDEVAYQKIENILKKIRDVLADEGESAEEVVGLSATEVSEKASLPISFTIKLDDPAGNSFLEFIGSMADPKWNMRTYNRTKEQNAALGLAISDEGDPDSENENVGGGLEGKNEEVYAFPGSCSSCSQPLTTYMKKVNIPYFKDILIMSTNCENCGYRDNEVKSGAAISEKGTRITLKVEDREDLSRDILKSETCGLTIPEIELVLHAGTLGGRFTTLEGILEQVYEELSEKVFAGDSRTDDHSMFETFLKNLKEVKNAERPFTLVLEDPLANSYLQNLYAPDPDPNMTIEEFERTWEQNEDLGLNDMKVEDYGESSEADLDTTKR